jgi:sodium/bile acid cotransporter 7
LRATFQRRWLLTTLLVVLWVGATWPTSLEHITERIPKSAIVMGVMFLMALTLPTGQIFHAVRSPGGTLWAIAINLGLLPPLAWLVSRPLTNDLADGVVIAATVPSTLASAAIWTRRAGGNDAIALMVTLGTNLACFVVTPAWLWLLTGRSEGEQDFWGLVVRLAGWVVLPIFLGQTLRQVRSISRWADRRKRGIGVVSQLGILSIVLVGAVHCGHRLADFSGQRGVFAGQVAAVLVAVLAIHLIGWALGRWGGTWWGLSREDALAAAFAGSQKTLMVGLAIAIGYGGLAVLPMMAFHASQLFADTLLADWQAGAVVESRSG